MVEEREGGMVLRPLEAIGTSAEWFLGELMARGLTPVGKSAMHTALVTLADFRSKTLAGQKLSFQSAEDTYDYFAEATGTDFLTKAIHWGSESEFVLPDDRWKLLRSGDPIITRISAKSSNDRNKTWETVIASLAATFATNVGVDEPDVTCGFKGETFAIAAKVAYSENNVPSKILEGFDQAEGKADASLVFVDVVNLYPQVETFRFSRFRKYGDEARAVQDIKGSVTRWCESRWDLPGLAKKIRAKTKRPVGVVFFVPLLLEVQGVPVPFPYVHMPLTNAGEDGIDYEFTRAFLNACNHVLGFSSGKVRATARVVAH